MSMFKAELAKITFEPDKGGIQIAGKIEGGIVMPRVILQERVRDADFSFGKTIIMDTEWNGRQFSSSILSSQLNDIYVESGIWDFYVEFGTDCIPLHVHDSVDFTYPPVSIENSIITMKPYITKNRNLALSVNVKEIMIEVKRLKMRRANIELSFILRHKDLKESLSIKRAQLIIRKRENQYLMMYKEDFPIVLDMKRQHYSGTITEQAIVQQSQLVHNDVWEFFILLKDERGNEVLLPFTWDAEHKLESSYHPLKDYPMFEGEYFLNAQKILSYRVRRSKLLLDAKDMKEEENSITFSAEFTQTDTINPRILDLYFRPRGDSMSSRLAPYHVSIPYELESMNPLRYKVAFSLSTFMDKWKTDYFIWDLYAKVLDRNTNSVGEWPLSVSGRAYDSGYKAIDRDYEAKLYTTKFKTIALMSRKISRKYNDSIKIATLGGCYSRSAFKSHPYFNPGYKEKYQVVYSQFHSAMASIMSEPVPFPYEYFRENNQTELSYLRSEFEKNFFTSLAEKQPDYFIFDFYADAIRDLIVFDKNHIITANYMVRRNKAYLNSIAGRVQVVNHLNQSLYLRYWHDAIERFAEQITHYIPQERIVLQKGRKINRYYDRDGQIHYFKGQKNIIERSNYYFDYMENYLLGLLPNIQVIDLTQENFIGHYAHPEGLTNGHYESAYYRSFLHKLDDIVLRNMLRDKRAVRK